MPENWSIAPASTLIREVLDDYLVCYSRESGETHILDAFPATILHTLERGSLTTEQLQREFAELMGGPGLERELESALRQLEVQALIHGGNGEAG